MRPAGRDTSRMTDNALTDLPHPDAPTSATVSPGRTSQDTPSTARITAPEVVKCVRRFLTSRRTSVIGRESTTSGERDRRERRARPRAGNPARIGPPSGATEHEETTLARVNDHYLELKSVYLFSDIAKRVAAFGEAHPGARLIRLGIGDVTRPLPPAVVRALHEAADEMARPESFRGYGPE